jgi:hypothetical protein
MMSGTFSMHGILEIQTFNSENLKRRVQLEHAGIDERTILP